MKKKQIISLLVIVVILAVLVYLQFRSWQTFDWAKFRRYTSGVSLWHIAAAIGLIYLSYVLRAVRWAIFLEPTKHTTTRRLLAPQFIGFSALGLFGRAGEFVRPYLIARKEELTLESQLAVWTVERAFDLAAVLLLMFGFIVLTGGRVYHILTGAVHNGLLALAARAQHNAVVAAVAVIALASVVLLMRRITGDPKHKSHPLQHRWHAFKKGFNTIRSWRSFALVALVSVLTWFSIAMAYLQVLHSYPQSEHTVTLSSGEQLQVTTRPDQVKVEDVLLLMGGSMFGSVIQLPGGVGGSQLAVISVLSSSAFTVEPYNLTRELAVSCGIMLWLVSFMSVIPTGVIWARFERISFLKVSEESEQEEEQAEAGAEA